MSQNGTQHTYQDMFRRRGEGTRRRVRSSQLVTISTDSSGSAAGDSHPRKENDGPAITPHTIPLRTSFRRGFPPSARRTDPPQIPRSREQEDGRAEGGKSPEWARRHSRPRSTGVGPPVRYIISVISPVLKTRLFRLSNYPVISTFFKTRLFRRSSKSGFFDVPFSPLDST